MTNGYAFGQLSQAFLTASTHEDPEARSRADRRAEHWVRVINAMAKGQVAVGSRTPVRGYPSWITLEVMRGGFATGTASGEGPLAEDEIALAQRLGIFPTRQSLFSYFLSEPGLHELYSLLDSGSYRVDIPEDAALLMMAWLVRSGDRAGALDIVDAIAPFAHTLRFAPKVTNEPSSRPELVYRMTAGEAAAVLQSRKLNTRVEAQREALGVWNPFTDRVLEAWRKKYINGRIDLALDESWRAQAAELISEYDKLAERHTLCSKHKKPKENLAILIRAMRTLAEGGHIAPRDAGLVCSVTEACLAKRGAPSDQEHHALRERQRFIASAAPHSRLAAIAAERLAVLEQSQGIEHPEIFIGDVTELEAERANVPVGSSMPPVVPRVVSRATSAPIETLLSDGVVSSSEILGSLIPRISATVVASACRDETLARLVAANYRAFRNRRSLLLVNLQKQVQLSELPWMRAALPHGAATTNEAMAVARRVGALVLDYFPATIIPNPLVRELQHLLAAAGYDVPLVEELAADIFMGRFSDKFRIAAQHATKVIGGTLYARYFAIDVEEVGALDGPRKSAPKPSKMVIRFRASKPLVTFGDLCEARAGHSQAEGWSVARNGTIIEQSQILTTHNLAALVTLGVTPRKPWSELARECISKTASLLELASRQPRPLPTVKDAAYAWRQAVFFLSVSTQDDAEQVIADPSLASTGPAVMATLMAGLRAASAGDPEGQVAHAPFVGWSVGRHWVLDAIGHQSHEPS